MRGSTIPSPRSSAPGPRLREGGNPVEFRSTGTAFATLPSLYAAPPPETPMAVIAVLTNLPDSESAFNLARELVHLRLAACANVLSPVTSFYRWDGKEEQAAEIPLLIKSTAERYAELERA